MLLILKVFRIVKFGGCSLLVARCSLFSVFCSLFTVHCSLSQPASPLDRVVTVEVRNERVGEVLKQIAQQGNFAFSYNPVVVNDTRTVTLRTVRQPVRLVLTQLFEGQTISWKTRGNYVLLLGEGETRKEPTHFYLDGYILDSQTGQKIAAASIYERTSLASTVSNPYGYYRLKLTRDLPMNARVEVRKRLYSGESVTVSARQSRTVDVRLRALPPPVITPTATSTTATAPSSQTVAIARADTLRPVVVDTAKARVATMALDTLPPPPTTAPQPTAETASASQPAATQAVRDSTKAVVDVEQVWDQTRQALGEVVQAARQLIHRQNLDADTLYRPFQLSLLPYVGTNHKLSNHVINRFSVNLVAGTALGVTGLELGAFINSIRGDVRGGQFAGFGNFVGNNVYGLQAAGFVNTVRGHFYGGQLAGFGNTTRGDFQGVQAGGFFNKIQGDAKRTIQLAGFSNRTQNLTYGIQVAGFVNHARTVRNSLQLAPFNVADSSNSIPIGLWSVVRRNGYRRFEVAANETFPLNITFRSGVKLFYNLLTVGVVPSDALGRRIWQVGYGVGTGLSLGRTWMVNAEGSGHVVWGNNSDGIFTEQGPNLLLRGALLLEKRFGRIALAAGPTVSFYDLNASENTLANTRLRIRNTPVVSSLPFTVNGWASWIGWQVGLRWVKR